ncbi:cytochrome c [Providencia burhodogranariea]|uniref:Gluconate 2-dehydrogenase (Acceptor) n=1 Tax=Providencia burhodogranariea DSM 19968 TaxID=1141662 RepID=K8WBX8_9GAMM|nr:cytochrome c [Providencia burhodogranariea]EKT58158.1 gluconate 2-dehydrogenase (acceptor) [Providencia burhodogranariea DSM 19968]
MKYKILLSLGFSVSLGMSFSLAAQTSSTAINTDSTGIPFGTMASQSGSPAKQASEFTSPSSTLYVPTKVNGQTITPQTSSGSEQVSSKMALTPIPVSGGEVSSVPPMDAHISQGKYLTEAADCSVCHTASGGKPYAGGLPFKTPFGTMYSSNITPDKEFGIGNWSAEEFIDAVKHGKRNDGENLYPSMPYTSYVKLTDDDARSIYDYLMTLPAEHHAPPANEMEFPYNQRWALTFWNILNFKDEDFTRVTEKSTEWNRGAYVADALGHCQECHTPRDISMGLKSDESYAGTSIDGWKAFNISPSIADGIGSWSTSEIVQYLRSGSVPGKATAAGPMAEVISHSTRYMTDTDLNALAVYLKDQPARGSDKGSDRFSQGNAVDNITLQVRGQALSDSPNGATLYNANCASCHGIDGAGIGKKLYYPSLFHNSTTGADDASNLVMVILNGVDRTDAQGRHIVMPAFSNELSSDEIATLATYVTKNFGNPNAEVTADQVEKLRLNEVTVIPGWLLISGGGIGVLIVLAIIAIFIKKRRKI